MGARGERTGIRLFLPFLVVCAALGTSPCGAQVQSATGEGGSAGSEPIVILSDGTGRVPLRQASRQIRESTDPLLKLAWETRETTRTRLLSTKDHTPWQIMHGLLGLRQDFLISHNQQVVNTLEWIQTGPTFRDKPWFQKTPYGGRAHPYVQPYWFEGHINQFLAILASCNVPLEAKFNTPDGPITMADMLKNAQMTVNAREEVTWTLWALATYLPWDARWTNAAGEQWSIEKLVQVETAKPVGGPTSPCGGTHGLFALARARNVYLRSGKPLRGVWFEADQKIRKYIEIARLYRNSDGSLSSGWFKTREYKADFDKRMASEGHLLEFLMMAVSQQDLKSDWVRRAVEAICKDLNSNQKAYVECSPLYHSANALSIFIDRMAAEQKQVASADRSTTSDLSGQSTNTVKVPATQQPGGVNPFRRPVQPRTPPPPPGKGTKSIAPPAPPASNLVLPPPKTNPGFPPAAPGQVNKTPEPAKQGSIEPAKPAMTSATPSQKLSTAPQATPSTQTPQQPAFSSSATRPSFGGPKPLPELRSLPGHARYPEPPPVGRPANAPGIDYRSQGVPVKSISTGGNNPVTATPEKPAVPVKTPDATQSKLPAPAVAPESSTKGSPKTAPSVSKTSTSTNEVIMLDEFLLGPSLPTSPTPAKAQVGDPQTGNPQAGKPPAAPEPAAGIGKQQ